MIRFYRVLYALLLLAGLLWALPTLYHLAVPDKGKTPFTLYSEVEERFLSLGLHDDGSLYYHDQEGNTYEEEHFQQVLPSFYYRQLAMIGKLPDTIREKPISAEYLQQEGFIFRSYPTTFNAHTMELYPLMESMPKGGDLQLPAELFRMTAEGIEFVNIKENRVDEALTAQYQQLFERKGVVPPVQNLAGNPTTRKAYDAGYLFADAAGQLFHLKRNAGRAFLRQIDLPVGVVPKYLYVTEYPTRRMLGLLIDKEGTLYAIKLPSYEVVQAGVSFLKPEEQWIAIFGNPFFWTVVQRDTGNWTHYTALEAETLQAVDVLTLTYNKRDWDKYLFPCQLSFTSTQHKYFKPTLHSFSLPSTLLWLVLGLLGGFLWWRGRRR